MKFLKPAAFVVGTLVALGAAATADAETVTFDWTLTGAESAANGGIPLPASGTLTATVGTNGNDQVTIITGTVDGMQIAELSTFNSATNLIFFNTNGTSLLNSSGLSFDTASGLDVNIFGFNQPGTATTGNAYGESTNGALGVGTFGVGTFALSPVATTPLPSTWTMMIAGLLGLGFVAFRATKTASTGLASV
jgi:hypothetical protein